MKELQFQYIKIDKLGPITHCEMKVQPMTILTGPQGAGKSTIAKAIYFFKMFKLIAVQQIQKERFARSFTQLKNTLNHQIMTELRTVFLQEFGSTWGMSKDLCLYYEFCEKDWIELTLVSDKNNPNYIWIKFSNHLSNLIKKWEKEFLSTNEFIDVEEVKNVIETDLNDNYEVVYIPAGRSMMTLLSNQMNYIYSTMDDVQKRMIDYCTKNYLEMTMKLGPMFQKNRKEMIDDVYQTLKNNRNKEVLVCAQQMMKNILNGEYFYSDGGERLVIENGEKYVKINFASSGQQESVWILNILFYYLLYAKETYVIIEEPESHLFPDAQKQISEFIGLFYNQNNQVLITTHSPYVLGSFNNMFYADKIGRKHILGIENVIDPKIWIDNEKMQSYFVAKGTLESCKDIELGGIKNEVIDDVSGVINDDFDKLLELYYAGKDNEC